jgi:hypothetical protein
MGYTTTPKYRVEVTTDNGYWTPQAWPVKYAGRPNAANLAAWVAIQEGATQPGGVNAHLGATRILTAKIVRNAQDGDLVAAYAK